MTIKEVEARTGLARSSIRFYEKEELIHPKRDDGNGYRNYTEGDIENIKKIAYLRTLGISLENIRQVINHEIELGTIIEKQSQVLQGELKCLKKSKAICEKMLQDRITYEGLDVEAYIPELTEYWESNCKILKKDTVSFFHLWGGFSAWASLVGICFVLAFFAYPYLPDRIPIQWNGEEVSGDIGKLFIFAYPIACIAIRFLLRPFIWRWFKSNFNASIAVSDYVTNGLCFITLSVEVFTILFVNGIVKHITIFLLIDLGILLGGFLIGEYFKGRIQKNRTEKE